MTHRLLSLSLLAATVAGAGLAAQQTAVFPSDHANRAGRAAERNLPLAAGISRTQIIYERFDLDIPGGHQITEVGFRQDDVRSSTGVPIQLEIWMGSSTNDTRTASGTFADNENGSLPMQQVFARSIVRLPDLTGTQIQDEFFITLDTPFAPHATENLIVEYRVFANANANLAFNYYLDVADYVTQVTEFGNGCQSSAGTTPSLTASASSYLGGSLGLTLRDAPANSLVWFNLAGVSSAPVDLTAFGAPGCSALVFPQTSIASQGSTAGTASLSVRLPEEASFLGGHLYSQVLVFDLFANNLGFVASNAVDVEPGIRPQMAVISAQGDVAAQFGSARRRLGLVSLFRHQ